MNISVQLDYVMSNIWDGTKAEYHDDPVIKALVSYVKNHSTRNIENVFEVIDVLWPKRIRTMNQRPVGDGTGKDQNSGGPGAHGYDTIVDVQFDDDSQVLVVCNNGIGNGLEMVS